MNLVKKTLPELRRESWNVRPVRHAPSEKVKVNAVERSPCQLRGAAVSRLNEN